MSFNLQPHLENDLLYLRPLQEDDFEALCKVASDPHIWEQHPSKERATREGFTVYFKDAMATKAAFVIIDKKTNSIIGTSRFNPVPTHDNAIEIGWTFLARAYWGSAYNPSLKKLMTDYAFQFVPHILFYVNEHNLRSQKAMQKIGGVRVYELDEKAIELKVLSTVVFKISRE
jgi:N-acetyltransferase